MQMILLQEARSIQGTKKLVVGFCFTMEDFSRPKPNALLAFSGTLNDMFSNYIAHEGKTTRCLAYLL